MLRLIVVCLSFLLPLPAFAHDSESLANTRVSLIAAQENVQPGSKVKVGVLLQPRPGWHTYWQNPGDAGIPTTLEWKLPESVTASDIEWPLPVREKEDALAIYGYMGDVLLPVSLSVPADYAPEEITVTVDAKWLVCSNVCVPESATLDISLPVGQTAKNSSHADLFTQFQAPPAARTAMGFHQSGNKLSLDWNAADLGNEAIKEAYFFPREENIIQYAADQTLEKNGPNYVLNMPLVDSRAEIKALSGYLTFTSVDGKKTSYDVKFEGKTTAAGIVSPPIAKPEKSYFTLLVLALVGGVILNLMPCVLPVLSLKALAVANKSGHARKIIVRQALAYTVGILVSFTFVAFVIITLRQGGEVIGWGFQMQSPAFIGAMILLLFLIGLNLSGMFELPVLFGSALAETREHRMRGSFATGVLAAAVATPCTAPFMAAAVGAALTMPTLPALGIFLSLGLGLALPFLLIALCPPLLRLLPKPGAWMLTFKQFLAFPIYASVIWLLWVLTLQAGADGLIIALIGMLVISFLIWLKEQCTDPSSLCSIAHLLLLASVFALSVEALDHITLAPTNNQFSLEKLESLRSDGKAVYVDATAAWCITCQVNKHTALDAKATRDAMEKHEVTLLVADWTTRNAAITEWLESFGYRGVPLNVYYPPGGAPVVMPQLLTKTIVIQTIEGTRP